MTQLRVQTNKYVRSSQSIVYSRFNVPDSVEISDISRLVTSAEEGGDVFTFVDLSFSELINVLD